MTDPRYGFAEQERRNAETLIAQALAEDLGQVGDITSTVTIPSCSPGNGASGRTFAGRAGWPARCRDPCLAI